eukprot:137510_1
MCHGYSDCVSVLFGKLLDACNGVASVCVCSLNILEDEQEWSVDELNDVRTASKWFAPREVKTTRGIVEIRFTNATNIKMDESAESYEEKRLEFDDIKEEEKANELSGTIGGGSMAGQSEFVYSNDGFRVLECDRNNFRNIVSQPFFMHTSNTRYGESERLEYIILNETQRRDFVEAFYE